MQAPIQSAVGEQSTIGTGRWFLIRLSTIVRQVRPHQKEPDPTESGPGHGGHNTGYS